MNRKNSSIVVLAVLATSLQAADAAAQGEPVQDHYHNLHLEIADPDPTVKVPEATFNLYGAIWFNYSMQLWQPTTVDKYANFEFSQLHIAFDASWHGFSMMTEVRIFSSLLLIRQAWLQYAWKDNAIQVGQIHVPWGRETFSSESWWFSLGWYTTFGEDYSYGLKYIKDNENYRLDVAYIIRDNFGLLDPTSRWSADLTPDGEQQNREFSSLAARGIYKLHHREDLLTELALSGQVGLLNNAATNANGYRWAVAATYSGNYGGWAPLVQVTRYEFRPNNPALIDGVAVDDRVVRLSQLGAFRDLAAKAFLFNFNLAKTIEFNRKILKALVPYLNYSWLLKDEDAFADSQLITPGLQIRMGPVWVWFDMIMGKNATFLNDTLAQSGVGSGAVRSYRFEYRPNLQMQYFF
ncbi:MAG: hypothetical protein WCF10_18415 [Polyangiales bacterium]